MLACFDLAPGVSVEEFAQAMRTFIKQMRADGLVVSSSPIGQRQRHPVMDTDKERDHDYFLTLSFENRDQCDRAVEYIEARAGPGSTSHIAAYAMIADPVFICWQDIGDALLD